MLIRWTCQTMLNPMHNKHLTLQKQWPNVWWKGFHWPEWSFHHHRNRANMPILTSVGCHVTSIDCHIVTICTNIDITCRVFVPTLMSTYYGCIQLEDWFSTHAQSLILALFRWWWKDNSGQTSNSGESSFNIQIIMDMPVSIASISS